MSNFWASRNGLDVAAAIIKIPRELNRIRELLEANKAPVSDPFSVDTSQTAAGVAARAEDAQQTTDALKRESAANVAKQAALTTNIQHISPIMEFGEMHTIYDTSDNPQRNGRRLGIVTRGVDGWLIEDAMIRMGPHGDERKAIVESRRALAAAVNNELPIVKVAKPEPHPKHDNAIKVYFRLLEHMMGDQENQFLGYLAADVADFIMSTPFGDQHTWKDGAKLDVLSLHSLGARGLRANLAIMDAHRRDEMRDWIAEVEEGLFISHVEE